MKRRLLITGTIAFLTLLFVVALVSFRPSPEDPFINGKQVSSWVWEFAHTGDTNASNVVLSNRAVAIPLLIAAFENRHQDKLRIRIASRLQPISRKLAGRVAPQRSPMEWHMLNAFPRLGPDPRLAETMLKALKDDDYKIRRAAAISLHPRLTDDISVVIDGLKVALNDREARVRAGVCWRLSFPVTIYYEGYGTNAVVLHDRLQELADADPSPEVRTNAAKALLTLKSAH